MDGGAVPPERPAPKRLKARPGRRHRVWPSLMRATGWRENRRLKFCDVGVVVRETCGATPGGRGWCSPQFLCGDQPVGLGGQVVRYGGNGTTEDQGDEFVGTSGSGFQGGFCDLASFELFGGNGDERCQVVDPVVSEINNVVVHAWAFL